MGEEFSEDQFTIWQHILSGTGTETELEEVANGITHGAGIILSVVAFYLMVLLLIKKGEKRSFHHILGCTVFGFSLLTLYTVSTVYHSSDFWFHQSWKAFYHKLDHISIFILIAGSYTPLLTIILMKHGKRETIGLMTLIFVWLFAASGTVLKIFVDIKTVPEYITNSLYLIMGWSIVLVGKPMYNATPSDVLRYIVAGGLVYSVGVGMLTFDSLHFNHAIWHCFVMAGSFFHFVAIVLAASHDESSWNKTLSFKSIVASLFSTENKVKTY